MSDLIARAREADLAAIAGRFVKLTAKGGKFWGCCPFHADRNPSFKIEHNKFHCFGCDAHGDVIDFVLRTENLEFRDAVLQLAGGEDRPRIAISTPAPVQENREDKVNDAREIWHKADAQIDLIRPYFDARRLPWPPPPSIRATRRFYMMDAIWPALVAAVQSPSGRITAVQVTPLSHSRDRTAFPKTAKTRRWVYGVLADGAVRLAKPLDVLGVSEGTETGLAAMHLTGVPVWACLGAGRMQRVHIPDDVREIHLFADDDGPGKIAVDRFVRQYCTKRIITRFPPQGLNDWNDVLLAEAA